MEGSYRHRDLGERVAAAEEQLDVLDREMLRVRSRLHELESDRVTIRLLMDQVKSLGERVSQVAGSIEAVAQRAAEKTIALAFADQDQIREFRDSRRRQRINTWAAALSVGVAFGGFVSALVFGIFK